MKIDKEQIINHLKGNGEQDKANEAEQKLPDQVDTEKDAGLLEKLGINPRDLLGKIPGF